MLIDNNEVEARLNSPLNLINRLRSISKDKKGEALSVFRVPEPESGNSSSPILPPSIDDVIIDAEQKIKLGSLHGKAIDVLDSCLDELKLRLPEVDKADKLSRIASDMGKITSSIRDSNKTSDAPQVQVLVYAPQIIPKDHFDVIHVEG